jgi:CRP/FNR family cyclic AMP-dependent transcriptional regulator
MAAFLDWLGSGKAILPLDDGAVVFRQGDPAESLFHVDSGRVVITVTSKQGKTAIVATPGAGEFFGEGCLAGQSVRMATARAEGDAVVTRIDRSPMVRLLRERPDLTEVFTAYLLSRNIQVEADLVDQMFNSTERRLARLLLLMAKFDKDGEFESVVPKVSQDVLAARIGTTRSRINHFMNKFRNLGYIEYNGSLKVHASLLNVVVLD